MNEDIIHVLRDCIAAIYVWVCLVPREIVSIFFRMGFDNWFLYNLKSKVKFSNDIAWPVIFGMACWFLWQRRNKELFDENYSRMESPSNAIIHYTKLICSTNSLS